MGKALTTLLLLSQTPTDPAPHRPSTTRSLGTYSYYFTKLNIPCTHLRLVCQLHPEQELLHHHNLIQKECSIISTPE